MYYLLFSCLERFDKREEEMKFEGNIEQRRATLKDHEDRFVS